MIACHRLEQVGYHFMVTFDGFYGFQETYKVCHCSQALCII